MARGLTNRQREVLTHIRAALGAHRPATDPAGVGRAAGHSLHQRRARSPWRPSSPRAIWPAIPIAPAACACSKRRHPPAAPGVRRVPLLGGVAAGQPLFADQELGDALLLDERVVPNGGAVFALRVRGDSMRDAAIHDGDYVVVREQRSAEPGDIVVALLEDEATVKRFFPERDVVRLQPENSRHEPVIVRRDDRSMRLLGKVTAVISHRP